MKNRNYASSGTYDIKVGDEQYTMIVKADYFTSATAALEDPIMEVTIKNQKGEIINSSKDSICYMETMEDGNKNFSYKTKNGFELSAKMSESNETVASTIESSIDNDDSTIMTKLEYDGKFDKTTKKTSTYNKNDKTKVVETSDGIKSEIKNYDVLESGESKLTSIESQNLVDKSSKISTYDNENNTFIDEKIDSNGQKTTTIGKFNITTGTISGKIYDYQVGVSITSDNTGNTIKAKYETSKTLEKIKDTSGNVFSVEDIMQTAKGKVEGQTIADVLDSIKSNIVSKSATDIFNTTSNESSEIAMDIYDEKAYQYNALSELLNNALKFNFNDIADRDEELALIYDNILKNQDEISSILNEMYVDLNSYLEAFGLDMSSVQNLSLPANETTQEQEKTPIGTAVNGGNDPTNGGTTPNGGETTGVATPTPTNVLDEEIDTDIPKNVVDKAVEAVDKSTPVPTKAENSTDTTKEEQDNLDKIIKATVDEIANLEELKYNEETFTKNGLVQRNGEMISGLNWRYYIQTDLKIVSEVTDYSVYGLSGVLNSKVNESTDGLGSKTLYSYVYDIDGNVLKDSVAKSTQSAFCIISDNDVDLAFARIIGKGNQTNYNTAGYVNVILDGTSQETSKSAYKILISGSRAKKMIQKQL